MAERKQKEDLTNLLLKPVGTVEGQSIRDYTGGVLGNTGAESALTAAVAADRKAYNDRIQEKDQLMRHFNLSSSERQTLALGGDVPKTRADGSKYIFKASDDYAREAAIEDQLKTGSFDQIDTIIKESGIGVDASGNPVVGLTSKYATTISSAVAKNGIANKAVYWGAKSLDDIAQGKIYGDDGAKQAIIYNLKEGKVKDEVFAGMDAKAIENMFKVGLDPTVAASITDPAQRTAFTDNVRELQRSAHRILNTDLLSRNASAKAKDVLKNYELP